MSVSALTQRTGAGFGPGLMGVEGDPHGVFPCAIVTCDTSRCRRLQPGELQEVVKRGPKAPILNVMALSWRRRRLDEVRREEAPEQFAIRDELVSIRPWFDAKVRRHSRGEPYVWMWVTPVVGLLVLRVQGDWYAQPMGYDTDQNPQQLGPEPLFVTWGRAEPKKVAEEVVRRGVVHALTRHTTLPPDMWLEGYDGQWASDELSMLAGDGLL